jgi:hypothetical protein
MLIRSVAIKRFRSVDYCEIADCGAFNVLIGRNNSGKSNLLSAIHAFFACTRTPNAVNIHPVIGRDIDFHGRQTGSPIEIVVTFTLSQTEREALAQDLLADAPQMQHAVDRLPASIALTAEVRVEAAPRPFSYMSRLAVNGVPGSGRNGRESPQAILVIGGEAARELVARATRTEELESGLKAVESRRVDEDDFKRYKSATMPIRYVLDRLFPGATGPLARDLRTLFDQAKSYEEFESRLRAMHTAMGEELAETQREPLQSKVLTFTGRESVVPNYVLNLIDSIAQMKVLGFTERRKEIGRDEAERLLALKVQRGGVEILGNLQETVSSLLGVRIDAFQAAISPRGGESSAELDVDDILVEANGSGVREALRVVLDVEFQRPSVLLIEEPEIHLHPALETGMLRYLKRLSTRCQVFITTHSTNFLDMADLRNVYLVSKPAGTQVQAVDFEEAADLIPRELGIRPSSLFMYDTLVFVEGVSDEDILREMAATVGVNLSQPNVGFIAMGGVRNFTHFAAQATLSFLSRRQVRVWFLVDRDERDEEEVGELSRRVGDRGVVTVLGKRELENYLICPRAVSQFIAARRSQQPRSEAPGPPSESEVEGDLGAAAEYLRQRAVDLRVVNRICRPVFPRVRCDESAGSGPPLSEAIQSELQRAIDELAGARDAIPAAYEEESRAVDERWDTDSLALVPGSLLLDHVCRKYGVSFRKARDGAALAHMMSHGEVAQEIADFLHAIGTSRQG